MDDLFDPHRLIDDDDDPLAALLRDGVLISEHLNDAHSWMALVEAIGKLDDASLKKALLATVTHLKRRNGMTDEQYGAWALKDVPRRDNP